MGKKRIIKKYEQVTEDVLKLIKERYPDGYEDNLISFPLPSGELALALPLETEEVSYLIRMPKDSIPEESEDDSDPATTSGEFSNFESLDVAEDIPDED